jgi:hypothetical protein
MDLDEGLGGLGLGFHFSVSQIIASLLFGIIGFYVFRFGKRTLNYCVILTGVALMIYPLFTSGPLQDWGVGILLCGLAYYFHSTANRTG